MVLLILLSAAFLAGLFAALLSANAARIGRWTGLLDHPDPIGGRKRHAQVTPLVGGMVVMVPVLLLLLGWALLFPSLFGRDLHLAQGHMLWIVAGVSAAFVLGLMDDRLALAPRTRLALSAVIFGVALLQAPTLTIGVLVMETPFPVVALGAGALLFSVLCLVGLLNAVNMADGKNGVVIGMCLVWTGCLALYAPPFLTPVLVGLAAALLVAFQGNLRGRFFLGDGGSYALSTLIGLLTIYTYNLSFDVLRVEEIMVWFFVPIADCLRLMVWRACRGRSPFAGDREHLHHYLHMTLGWPRGLLVYLGLVAVPSVGAAVNPGWAWAALGFAAFSYVLLLALAARSRPALVTQ